MSRREIVLLVMVCLFASACSPYAGFEAESELPLYLEVALGSAGGRTFFVAHELRAAGSYDYDIVLGTTDGATLEVEQRITPEAHDAGASTDVWAVSADEGWAIADGHLFHRDASGWSEVALELDRLGGSSVDLLDVAATSEGIAVSASYDPSPSGDGSWVDVIAWVGPSGVAIEALPEGVWPDDLSADADGELLVLGPTLIARRAGAWESAPSWSDPGGLLWRASDGGGYGFDGAHLARWSGGEVGLERLPLDDAPAEGGGGSETIEDVLAIGDELWALIGVRDWECSTGLFFPGTCGYALRSYRAMVRTSGGEWVDANGTFATQQPFSQLAEIDDEAWLVTTDADAESTHLARFGAR